MDPDLAHVKGFVPTHGTNLGATELALHATAFTAAQNEPWPEISKHEPDGDTGEWLQAATVSNAPNR